MFKVIKKAPKSWKGQHKQNCYKSNVF